MKQLIIHNLLAVALLAPATGAAQEFDKLVDSVEAFYRDNQNFSALFEQTVTRAHLPDRPVVKKGKVYFKKPGMMRWDYEEPDKVFYVSDGEHLFNYIPESKLVYKLEVKDSEMFYALRFLYGEGSLRDEFDLTAGKPEGELRVIIVKPKSSQHNFQQLKLLVHAQESNIAGTEILDPAGNISRITFLKTSYEEHPEKGIKLTPPPGVQVEDLSAPAEPPKP